MPFLVNPDLQHIHLKHHSHPATCMKKKAKRKSINAISQKEYQLFASENETLRSTRQRCVTTKVTQRDSQSKQDVLNKTKQKNAGDFAIVLLQ